MAAKVRIACAGDTHIGKRPHNEDAVLLRRELGLFALADGAGGENAGNVASSMALATIAHHFEATLGEDNRGFDSLGLPIAAKRLSSAVHLAHKEVLNLSRSSERFTGMGSTVVALAVDMESATAQLGHVGDSRAYRLRGGILELLTADHSLVNDVLELTPELTEERARELPRRVVTRALGMETQMRVTMRSLELRAGDRFLLCSDGLSDELDEEQLRSALSEGARPDVVLKILMDVALAKEANDNVGALVLHVEPYADVDWPTPRLRARPSERSVASGGVGRLPIDEDAIERAFEGAEHIELERGDSEPPTGSRIDVHGKTLELDEDEATRELRVPEEELPMAKTQLRALEPAGAGTRTLPPILEEATNARVAAEELEGEATQSRATIPETEPGEPEKGALEELEARDTDAGVASKPKGVVTDEPSVIVDESAFPDDTSQPEDRGSREETRRFERSCQKCGAIFDGPADLCPLCW